MPPREPAPAFVEAGCEDEATTSAKGCTESNPLELGEEERGIASTARDEVPSAKGVEDLGVEAAAVFDPITSVIEEIDIDTSLRSSPAPSISSLPSEDNNASHCGPKELIRKPPRVTGLWRTLAIATSGILLGLFFRRPHLKARQPQMTEKPPKMRFLKRGQPPEIPEFQSIGDALLDSITDQLNSLLDE